MQPFLLERRSNAGTGVDALDHALRLQWDVAVRLDRFRNFMDAYDESQSWMFSRDDKALFETRPRWRTTADARSERSYQSYNVAAQRESAHAFPIVEAEIAKRKGVIANAFTPPFRTCAGDRSTGASPTP